MRLCSLPDCNSKHLAKGFCRIHYRRWTETGSPYPAPPTPVKTCNILGCATATYARGWCNKHYQRWQKGGRVDPGYEQWDHERFWKMVERPQADDKTTCWTWSGGLRADGYGRFTFNGHRSMAHRFAYEMAKGPIPLGLDIDHLCRVRHCVNPHHLEAVTRRENLLRGAHPNMIKARARLAKERQG